MVSPPRNRYLALAFAIAATTVSPPLFAQKITPEESHARMLRELAEVRGQTDDTNFYLGDGRARQWRNRVANFSSKTSPSERFDGIMRLALLELNLGNEREAIALFEKAQGIFKDSSLPPRLLEQCLFFNAVAWLRIGETENCCRQPSPDSCLFPIRGQGIHSETEGSSKAIQILNGLLSRPSLTGKLRAETAWLLNLAHMTLDTWPDGVAEQWRIQFPEDTEELREPFPRFPNVAADRGLGSYGLAGGAIADDFDGDGRIDVMVSCWDPAVSIRFFLQQADGTFADCSEQANLTGLFGGLNLIQADYDNDGDIDVLVLRGAYLGRNGQHPNSLLRNDGPGPDGIPRFIDVTYFAGLGARHAPTQTAAWGDYDLDGDLDLFVGNETFPDFRCASQLFKNQGDGTFVDITAVAGVENFLMTKGSGWGDYDGDGDPDLYVANIDGPNRLYRNHGNDTFIDVAAGLGVTGPHRSFPMWFWDFNNDGALDIFASNYTTGGRVYWPYYRGEPLVDEDIAALYQGDGKGGFTNIVREANLDAPMVPMGANFGDLNNDGYPDIYFGTGTPNYADVVPNLLFVSQKGRRFVDRTIDARMGHVQKGHGVAFADFDNDGDLDVFEEMGGAVPGDPYYDALFENPGFPGTHWIQIRLVGVKTNRFGVGCRIRAVIDEGDTERSVYCHVNSGGSFGANPLIQHMGLGKSAVIKQLEIYWPVSRETQVLKNVPADQRIRITEGQDSWETF